MVKRQPANKQPIIIKCVNLCNIMRINSLCRSSLNLSFHSIVGIIQIDMQKLYSGDNYHKNT